MLTKNVQNTLVGYWIAVQFNSATFSISMASIEQDGRKQKKVKRALVDAGYLNIVDGVVEVTSKAFDELKAEEPDMFKIWQSNNRQRSECIAMVAKDCLSNEQLAYVLAHKDDFKFYVFTHDDVVYGHKGDRVGPCTFEQIGAQYKAMNQKSKFMNRPVVMITTDTLEKQVNDLVSQTNLNNLVSSNLHWGLVNQGILEENEDGNIRIHSGNSDSVLMNPIYSASNLGNDPTKWDERLNQAIASCESNILKLQTTLHLLDKTRKGINAIGGMDQFIQNMRNAIEKATIDQKEKESKS